MQPVMMFVAVLLPVLAGVLAMLIPFSKRKYLEIFLEGMSLLDSVLVYSLLTHRPTEAFAIVRFTGDLTLSFRIDGMGMVFGALAAALWPLAMLYAFEYMRKEKHQKLFFLFYMATYGVTLGIAFAEDLVTMYFFYELLTLVTVPLVMHTLTREAILASRKYLYYSLGGAAFGFLGMIFIIVYGISREPDGSAAADLRAGLFRLWGKGGGLPV